MAKDLKYCLIRKNYVLDAGIVAKENPDVIIPFSNMTLDRKAAENSPYVIPTEEKVKELIATIVPPTPVDPTRLFTGGQGQATDTAISREIKDSAGNQIVLASDGTDATVAVGDATFSRVTEIAKDSVAIIDKTLNSQGVKFTNVDVIYTDATGTNTQESWENVLTPSIKKDGSSPEVFIPFTDISLDTTQNETGPYKIPTEQKVQNMINNSGGGFTPTQANIYPAVAPMLVQGTNVSLTKNATNNTITINASGGGTSGQDDLLRSKGVVETTGQTTLGVAAEPLISSAEVAAKYQDKATLLSTFYQYSKAILSGSSTIDVAPNDSVGNIVFSVKGGGGSGLKTFTDTDTQSTVFAAVNVGDRVRFTQDNTVVNVYDSSSQGEVFAKDANSATFILQKEGIGYDLMIATISNGGTGTITATPTNFKIQDLEIEDSNGEYVPRIDKIKAYIDAKGSGDGAPWILYTGAQFIQQVNDANLQAQKIFEIPIDMSGVKKYISAGYTVQAQLIDNNAATGPIKLTSSKWTTTFNAYIDATLPEISNQVKVEYSGNGSLAVRTWYFIDKITDPQQWTFNTYMAVSNFTTDHFDWFEFYGGVGAANTVALERSHIQVPPSPDDRKNFQAYTTPPRFGINPDWTEYKDTPSINGNYNDIQELNALIDNYGTMKVKVDNTANYLNFLDYSATETAINPILTLNGASGGAGDPNKEFTSGATSTETANRQLITSDQSASINFNISIENDKQFTGIDITHKTIGGTNLNPNEITLSDVASPNPNTLVISNLDVKLTDASNVIHQKNWADILSNTAGTGSWVQKDTTTYNIPDEDTGKLCRITFSLQLSNFYFYGQLGTKAFKGYQLGTAAANNWTERTLYVALNPNGNWKASDTLYFVKTEEFFVPAKPQRSNTHEYFTGADNNANWGQISFIEVWE